MIPPKGFKAELYPLRHEFFYSLGLNAKSSDATNSTMLSFVRNYKTANNPDVVNTNPHNASFDIETGAICNPMSIIDKMKIIMNFNLSEDAITDGVKAIKVQYMPIFTSFTDKLDSTDEFTTTTAGAVLELTHDATLEDVTPAFGTDLPESAGTSEKDHPVSTINFTEVFGSLNLSTNLKMEAVPWNSQIFFRAMRYYTNKGAIRSMVGRMRTITLSDSRPSKTIFINKFVPRAVRRIVPFSFFGMLVHVPNESDPEQYHWSGAITTAKVHVGIKCKVLYDEWHLDHNQDMATT